MQAGKRWQAGTGPGVRRLPWITRFKRWLVDWVMRDARMRRMAMSQIFRRDAVDDVLCLVTLGDHRVFVDPRDDRVAHSVVAGKGWQRDDLSSAINAIEAAGRLKPGGVFLDVGANIGLMTLYALLSGRFGSAIAIEPDARNRSILEKNLELNGLAGRVQVVGMAASGVNGSMTLHRDKKNFGAHSLERGFVLSPHGQDVEVPVDRLDAIVAEAGIAFRDIGMIKIDVEGHEFAVLSGMTGLIVSCPPVLIEVTFDKADPYRDMKRLREKLGGYDHVIDIGRGDHRPVAPGQFQPLEMQHELLFY